MLNYSDACNFSHLFPKDLATFLEVETRIRGARFREDSCTALLLAALSSIPGSGITLIVPPEPITGSDLDIYLYDYFSSTYVGYRLQAKRVSIGAKNWDRNSYHELAYKNNTGSQYAVLVAACHGAVPLTPLYAFYHPESICSASSNRVEGVMLADAFSVGVAIGWIKSKAPQGRTARQIRTLQHLFFPLSHILCPPMKSARTPVATPKESREVVSASIALRRGRYSGLRDAPLPLARSITQPVSDVLGLSSDPISAPRIRTGPKSLRIPRLVINASRPLLPDADPGEAHAS